MAVVPRFMFSKGEGRAMKNPYEKPYHMAAGINQHGGVTALCFQRPRLTFVRDEEVNRLGGIRCEKCETAIEESDALWEAIEQALVEST